MADPTTPAGWYADPVAVAELRYWDGSTWTEHVSTGGVQSVAALPASRSLLECDAFTVERPAEVRGPAEHGLDVLVEGVPAARFEPTLEGAPGYRLGTTSGQALLSVTKPGLKATVHLTGADGQPLGTITRVGRLHSRYDLKGPDGRTLASAKLVLGDDRWEITGSSVGVVAAMDRLVRTPPDGLSLAGAEYRVSIEAADAAVRPLLVALPLAVDILDTQTG